MMAMRDTTKGNAMELFSKHSSMYPKVDAQQNLQGRSHYVDDDTLRYHHSRVISTHVTDGGLLFAVVTSDAKDMDNRQRGFRFVVFDVFGTVISRDTDAWFRTSDQCRKAMWTAVNAMDAAAITREGIARATKQHAVEMQYVADKLETLISDGKVSKPTVEA